MNIALAGRATDEWTKTYPLDAGGQVHIANTSGKVEIQGVEGSRVEVHALRIARAATDAAARELLPRIVITEDIRPGRVSVETQRAGGILMGAGFEVQYRVKAPRGAAVDVTNSNGAITLTGLVGKVTARTSNGTIAANSLGGAVEARSTNGSVSVDLAALGGDRIALGTTNGSVVLILPEGAGANLVARTVNGGISITGVQFQASEQSRRRVEGRINGGGPPVELTTTNGGIRIRTRGA